MTAAPTAANARRARPQRPVRRARPHAAGAEPQPGRSKPLLFQLVLPAFNEGPSLSGLVARALAAAEHAGFAADEVGLVVVDNGSSDDTQAVLAKLCGQVGASRLQTVHVRHNEGYGHGLWAGLKATTAEYVGWTHADEQCDPADAFVALARVQQSDRPLLVKGARVGRSLQEQFVSRTFEACARLSLGLDVAEVNAQPKVMPRALLADFVSPPKDFGFDLYALYAAKKQGYDIESMTVAFAPRAHGVSRWAVGLGRRWRTIGRMLLTMASIKRREGSLPRSARQAQPIKS